MGNKLLNQITSNGKHLQDPYSQVSELMDEMLLLIEIKRNKESELSEEEIDEQLDQKHKLMIQITVENLDVMEEKANEVRKRLLEKA